VSEALLRSQLEQVLPLVTRAELLLSLLELLLLEREVLLPSSLAYPAQEREEVLL